MDGKYEIDEAMSKRNKWNNKHSVINNIVKREFNETSKGTKLKNVNYNKSKANNNKTKYFNRDKNYYIATLVLFCLCILHSVFYIFVPFTLVYFHSVILVYLYRELLSISWLIYFYIQFINGMTIRIWSLYVKHRLKILELWASKKY